MGRLIASIYQNQCVWQRIKQHVKNLAIKSPVAIHLWDISREYDVTIAELATWNNLKKNAVLRVGQTLTVYKDEKTQLAATQTTERTITYKVRRGDSLARIAAKFNVSVDDIIKWNSLAGQKYIQPGQKLKLRVDVRSA